MIDESSNRIKIGKIPLNVQSKWEIKDATDLSEKRKYGKGLAFILDKLAWDVYECLDIDGDLTYNTQSSILEDILEFLFYGEINYIYKNMYNEEVAVLRKSYLPCFKTYKKSLELYEPYLNNSINPQTLVLLEQKTMEYGSDERRGFLQRMKDIVATRAGIFAAILKGNF